MRGIILINAYSPAVTRQARRMSEELEKLGANVSIARNDFFPYSTECEISGGLDCEFCVYLDKDKYVSRMMEKSGVRLFDNARAIELCDDKMLTHIELAGRGIPMPKTLPGLLCYDRAAKIKSSALDRIEAEIGYPVIVKQSFGSLGKGVFKADDRAELIRILESIKCEPHLFQRYIAPSSGKDMRVIVIGGKVVGGIIRASDGDFRSNIGLGAHAVKTDVPSEIAEIATAVATALDLDYCGIDFLLAPKPLVCEVNSNAFFDAFEQATGINVAKVYAEHIINNV